MFADKISVSNASATGAAGELKGGKYQFSAHATFGGGTVKIEMLSHDGVTWIDVTGLSVTAEGTAVSDLPPGQYRINIATATAVYASLVRCPQA